MKANAIEILTGAIVIAVAVVFFIFAYQIAEVGAASGGYQVDARFSSASGLVTGDDVRLAGIKVGSVVNQRLDTETFEAIVTLSVSPDVKLPNDTSAQIAIKSLLGGNYVLLQAGDAEETLAAGDTIKYTGAVDLMGLIIDKVFGD